jgi:hypothetical protein
VTSDERSNWAPVTDWVEDQIGDHRVVLGGRLNDLLGTDPEELLALLTKYKFAAKMLGRPRRVLELGCGDGLGTLVLAKECGSAHGVDRDVDRASRNWIDDRVSFAARDDGAGGWDGLVALAEGSTPAPREAAARLTPSGMAVVRGAEVGAWRAAFVHVFAFSVFGEIIRAGVAESAPERLLVCVKLRPG